MRFAYLTQGKLYYRDGEQAARIIESAFAQDVVNRALASQQKQSWKTTGTSSAAMLARQTMGNTQAALQVRISAVAPGPTADELYYVVSTESVGGLFTYNLSTQRENRIFHKEALKLSDFSKHPTKKDVIACSQKFSEGNATISMCIGNDVSQVTEGDSSDECPRWVPGKDNELVYQSAGVARNQAGFMVGLGPTCIQRLDIANGTVTPLAEDENYDYLSPYVDATGNLFYIKRPYEPPFKREYPWYKAILDILMFPFRLLRAIFDFLNIFSMTFSKKPLTTAGGPKLEGPDEKALFLRGRMIDAEKALNENNASGDALYLVPRTWQLVRRGPDAKEVVLADGVLTYDVHADGFIIYSTGAAIYECAPDGSQRKLLSKEKFVDKIVALD